MITKQRKTKSLKRKRIRKKRQRKERKRKRKRRMRSGDTDDYEEHEFTSIALTYRSNTKNIIIK